MRDLQSLHDVDRYAAVKALRYREDLRGRAMHALEDLLHHETEERVALETAGAAAGLGSALGQDRIRQVLWGRGRADLRMEAIFIMTELRNTFAREELRRVADRRDLVGEEIRQAAVWGLGKAGLKAYNELLPFLDDADENVALHAIAAFGEDTPQAVIDALVQELRTGHPRRAPAASEALRIIGNRDVLEALVEAAQTAGKAPDWILATLGRLSPAQVQQHLAGTPLLQQVAPLLLIAQGANWLSTEAAISDISFLLKQDL
jgi:HEAT repeat protein